jgi:putative methanogenesis marker protein 8
MKPQDFNEFDAKITFKEGRTTFQCRVPLKNPRVERFFDMTPEEARTINMWQNQGLTEWIKSNDPSYEVESLLASSEELVVSGIGDHDQCQQIMEWVREHYTQKEMHITRMFGSYILIQRVGGTLKAVKATPIPIKYCPLMIQLLQEVGGDVAQELIASLAEATEEVQSSLMCRLIDEVVIAGGYFDDQRPLNSCEANVLFGASEIMSSAFFSCLLDGAVIVSNNLGTIITTSQSNTQGAVKRMTGLFYTSPSKAIVETAIKEGIKPVFPYTARIDQVEGVRKAISLGMKNIAVSVASKENVLLEALSQMETEEVCLYRFGLCTTGIDEETAKIMARNADIVWSCASKQVIEHIEPHAIAQVGMKIPVHVMTQKGWYLVKNHLKKTYEEVDLSNVVPAKGTLKPILLNDQGTLKVILKSEANPCTDCPSPCI